jgi:hypothetical protein
MRKITSILKSGIVAAGLFFMISCGPNDDGNSTDTKNSNGEGSTDSTRLPGAGADSTHMQDTMTNTDTSTNR